MRKYYQGLILIWLVAIAAVVLVQVTSGGARADKVTMADLQSIKDAISEYAMSHNALPASLSDLNIVQQSTVGHLSKYIYSKTGYNTYSLCTIFKTDNTKSVSEPAYTLNSRSVLPQTHKAGYQCFTQEEYMAPVFTPTSKPVMPLKNK